MLVLLGLITLLVSLHPGHGIDIKCGPSSKHLQKRSANTNDQKFCRVSKQCSNGKICKKNDVCGMVRCEDNADCVVNSYLPVRCQQIFPGHAFCVQTECSKESDCKNAALDVHYGCFLDGQCKPSYGDCTSSCDCVDNFNMKKGEAYCHKNKCYCRTEHLHVCFAGKPPPEPVPVTPNKTTSGVISNITEKCEPNRKKLSQKGGPCNVHSGCIPWGGLVCIRSSVDQQGECKDVACKTNEDCTRQSILPLECLSGWCRPRFCSKDSDCNKGYGCYHDGRCKRILGTCQFHCDCGNCPGVECFRGQCFCQNDQDSCTSIVGRQSNRRSLPQRKHKSCKPKKCPEGWQRTGAGCYKLFTGHFTHQEAEAKCEAEGGYLVEITSERELHETKHVLGAGHQPVWMGGKREGGSLRWNYDRKSIYTPVNTRMYGNQGKCFLYTDTEWTTGECEEQHSALCEITPLQKN